MSTNGEGRQLSGRELAAIHRGHWVLDDLIGDLVDMREEFGGRVRVRAELAIYPGGTSSADAGEAIKQEWQYKVRCQQGKIRGRA